MIIRVIDNKGGHITSGLLQAAGKFFVTGTRRQTASRHRVSRHSKAKRLKKGLTP